MPGIAGIISQRPANECEAIARAMVNTMNHETSYVSGMSCAPELGAYCGWVAHEGSFAAEQNGHNAEAEFRLCFAGECFGPDRDILKLYDKLGTDCFRKLNGLFSGLLIDKKLGKIFLFNDRYGSERIYWHEAGGTLYFASEAKALLRVLPDTRRFDDEGVAQFLTYGCTIDGKTLFRGIELLPAAAVWCFDNNEWRKRTYFSPETWESQEILSEEVFDVEFEKTFKRILPRYFDTSSKLGISLTGGLDTRMVMACRPETTEKPVTYTFTGRQHETLDDRLARAVADACGVEHHLLRLDENFFSDFADHADRSVYFTDGTFGVTGAHEIYFNKQARCLSPVRMTGLFGSEILRGISTFKPIELSPRLISAGVSDFTNSSAEVAADNVHPVTSAAFRNIPWNLFGSFAASRSQVTVRTPYLDNEIVALAYQAPSRNPRSPRTALYVVEKNDDALSKIPTDRRIEAKGSRAVRTLKRLPFEGTFRLDYLYSEGMPSWLLPLDPVFDWANSTARILGHHKYLNYRSWFRKELASYASEPISDSRVQQSPLWNRGFLRSMVSDHIGGRANYIREINAVLTLEAVDRLLLRRFSSGQTDRGGHLDSIALAPAT